MELRAELSKSGFTQTRKGNSENRKIIMMRALWLCLVLSITATILSACGSGSEKPITPAVDRLTFLFFYTDG